MGVAADNASMFWPSRLYIGLDVILQQVLDICKLRRDQLRPAA